MYMNLRGWNDHGTYALLRARQNWVVVAMASEGRYATAFNATPLGNGCSNPTMAPTTTSTRGPNPIGPRP